MGYIAWFCLGQMTCVCLSCWATGGQLVRSPLVFRNLGALHDSARGTERKRFPLVHRHNHS
jgi:hypothetical protein